MKYLQLFSFLLLSSSTLLGQEITEFQGPWSLQYFEDDRQITRQEAKALILSEPDAAVYWKKWQKQSAVGLVSFLGATGFAIWANARSNNDKSTTVPVVGAVVGLGVGLGYATAGFNNRKKAILTYNKKFDVASMHIGQTANGLGIVMSF